MTVRSARPAHGADLGRKVFGVYPLNKTVVPSDTSAFYQTNPGLTVDRSSSAGVGPASIGSVAVTGTYTGRVTVLSKGGSTTTTGTSSGY